MPQSLAAVVGAVGIGVGLFAGAVAARPGPIAQALTEGPDLPPGITLVAGRIGGSGNDFGRNRGRPVTMFADRSGAPLYAAPDGTDCSGACLEKWRPVAADRSDRALGDWTLVARAEGVKQWAFRGRPLYTYVKEPAFLDDIRQAGIGNNRSPLREAAGHGVDGWAVASADVAEWMLMPTGIGATEYQMAPGQILAVGVGVATPKGKPLYSFTGSAAEERQLPAMFRPRLAAMMDLPVGEFTLRRRADGSRQWAFRGAPLYTCDCDVDLGDVNGKDMVAGIGPAVLLRYFVPAEVVLQKDPLSGGRLLEARTGQTLYFRERVKDAFDADHVRARRAPDPTVGRTLGVDHCDRKCEKEWRPLLAPKDARPRGYWSVYERPDGRKQWAYYDFALYTHAGEPPGSLFGNETYTVNYDEGYSDQPPHREAYGMALVWRGALP